MKRGLSPKGGHNRLISGRIWDLRRGDYNDNRTSPYVHGWASILGSAVLEFNYLKASLSFVALILGPALLLGLAPSVGITYGRLKLEALALVGRSLTVALLLLGLLLGGALWVGRRLLRWLVDNFWDLHYTLVFPLFVAVRESVRTVAERVPTRASTPKQIDERRRVATVVAGLLLVGGGLGLALGISLASGLQFVDVRYAPPGAIARAALVNAAVLFGLSTAVESCYWLWRERTLGGPVLDWVPGPWPAASPGPRLAHLSDLHLVGERYGYRMEAGTPGPRGNRRLARALRKLVEIHAAAPVDHILVTGDVTDAGTRAEWAEFLDLLRGYPELRARLSFVPGNHDVNIVERAHPGRLDLPWGVGLALRKLRVVLALDAIQGERAHVVDRDSGALGPTLAQYLRRDGRLERLRALAEAGKVRGRIELARTWESIFPLVEPAPPQGGCGLILLNSNSRGYFSLTSAVGVVNPPQLRALRSILRNQPQQPWALLLHHAVVEYPVTSVRLRDRIGLALVNAPELLEALRPHAGRLVVFHGHRHWDWIGTCGRVVLCSAPSVMLGSHSGAKDCGSFHVHQLALGPDGGFQLTATERVEVA